MTRFGNCVFSGAAASALALSMAYADAASAQTAPAEQADEARTARPADNSDGDAIVVTARRVAESAQDVPVAVSVLSADSLAERHIVDGYSLQGQIPSLQVGSFGQTRDAMTYTLRGLGQGFSTAPAVAVYINDVPMISAVVRTLSGPVGTFLDLQSVQVVNGPQGTLFGRNTTGGAVILTPTRPTDRFEGYLMGELGNYKDRALEGVINAPITSNLAIRIAGHIQKREGFTRDIVTDLDYDNKNYRIIRGSVLWEPAPGIENLLVGYYSSSRTHAGGDIGQTYNVVGLNNSLASRGGCVGAGYGVNCSAITDYAAMRNALGPRYTSLNGQALRDNRVIGWGITDRASFEVASGLTINNIVSFSKLKARTYRDQDGSPFPIQGAPLHPVEGYPDAYKQFTEEFQLQGDVADKKLQYTAGIYFERTQNDGDNTNIQISGFNPIERITTFVTDKKSLGFYGQATLDFGILSTALDGLRLTGGIRYTKDNADYVGISYRAININSPIISCSNGVSATPKVPEDCAFPFTYKRNVVTWTAGLDYKITPDVLAYAKVSRGYKTGGANFNAVSAATATYKPEFVISYEAGVKTSFRIDEVRGTFNVAAYSNDFRNVQKTAGIFNPTNNASGSAVFNAAKAITRGFEAELALRYHGLSLSGNYSRLDAKYKEFKLSAPFGQVDCSRKFTVGTVDLTCLPVEGAAKNQFSISGTYDLPLSENVGKISISANYAYIGSRYVSPLSLPELEIGATLEAVGLLNGSIAWDGVMGTPVDLRVFVTNLTNKTYRIGNTNVYTSLNYQSSIYGEPRMYGLQTKVHF